MIKKLLGTVAFVCVFLCAFSLADRVLRPKYLQRRTDAFYAEDRNSLDVVFYGSSHMYFTANPVHLWEEAGIPSFVFATPGQPMWYAYHYLAATLKVQKPKVVVVDTYMAAHDLEYFTQEEMTVAYLNQAVLPMRHSLNRAHAAMLAPEDMRVNLMLGFPYYHDRANLQVEDLSWAEPGMRFKGFSYSLATVSYDTPDLSGITEQAPLPELAAEYLEKTVELARKNGVEIIFTVMPFWEIEDYQPYMNTVQALADRLEVPFFNFNTLLEETGLDYATDFADGHHANYGGSTKVMDYLLDYMAENYQMEDRRGQKGYEDWDAWYGEASASIRQSQAEHEQKAEEGATEGEEAPPEEEAPGDGPVLVEEITE